MSELIDDTKRRKGEAPDAVRPRLVRLLGQVPYGLVVEVEQELISEGLPADQVLELCDVHTQALEGAIDTSDAATAPPGHPVDVLRQENRALAWELEALGKVYEEIRGMDAEATAGAQIDQVRARFNALMDVDKHYQRKENLVFPKLEKHGVTGPPTVMWGKHDEARAALKGAIQALAEATEATAGEAEGLIDLVLAPAGEAVAGMIDKEEQILLPMCMDTLDEAEWYEIDRGSAEIGFCLYAPEERWQPEGVAVEAETRADSQRVTFPTGALAPTEIEAILNTIPFDLTFVDADDKVRYFTAGRERIFARTKAIIGREVQYCHPPSSVATVQRILDDFRAGRQSRAAFWLELGGRFISIEYFAVRGTAGEYLGTLEVSQELTAKRALEGQQRLLSYDEGGE